MATKSKSPEVQLINLVKKLTDNGVLTWRDHESSSYCFCVVHFPDGRVWKLKLWSVKSHVDHEEELVILGGYDQKLLTCSYSQGAYVRNALRNLGVSVRAVANRDVDSIGGIIASLGSLLPK